VSPDQRATPRSTDLGPSQVDHLEAAATVFVVLAAMLLFIWLIWLAIRDSAEWILSSQPNALLQEQTPAEQQTPPQQQSPLQQQTPPQQQTVPQQRHRPLPRRRPLLDGVIVGDCPPLGYWAYHSPRVREPPLREPPRRSAIECWRDRSIRGSCFD
jgi:hypothetical protein